MSDDLEFDISLQDKIFNVVIENMTFNDDEYFDPTTHLTDIQPLTASSNIDLSRRMDLVYDQGSIGSCVANTLSWATRFKKISLNPSRLYLYYYCRVLDSREGDNAPSIDDGTTIRQGINVLRNMGVVDEVLYPYITSKHGQQPPTNLNVYASRNRVLRYSPLRNDIQTLKTCLDSGHPFSFGILVFSSFVTNAVTRTGNVPLPNTRTERMLGGHALCAVGYDDTLQVFKFVNSWGRGWGSNGYGTIPYSYITSRSLAGDFWVIYDVSQLPNITVIPVVKKKINKKRLNQIRKKMNPINFNLWMKKHKYVL